MKSTTRQYRGNPSYYVLYRYEVAVRIALNQLASHALQDAGR